MTRANLEVRVMIIAIVTNPKGSAACRLFFSFSFDRIGAKTLAFEDRWKAALILDVPDPKPLPVFGVLLPKSVVPLPEPKPLF